MAAKLITYDLSKPGQNYKDLHDAIDKLGNWWHCVESTWIVDTTLSCSAIRDRLRPYLDQNDKLAVFTLTKGWATQGMSKECNDWLHNHI